MPSIKFPYKDPDRRRSRAALELPAPSFWEMIKASGQEAWVRNPTSSTRRMTEVYRAQSGWGDTPEFLLPGFAPFTGGAPVPEDDRFLSPEEWKTSEHYREDLSFPDGVKQSVAQILAERKDEENKRLEVLRRAPKGPVSIGSMLATDLIVSALDPMNVAASFVPVVSQARYAGWVAKRGKTLARAGRGAVEGVAGAAMVEPLVLAASSQEQADYTMADSLINVGMGTILGAGLHTGLGAIGDRFKLRAAVGQLADDREVRVDALDATDQGKLWPGQLEPRDRIAGQGLLDTEATSAEFEADVAFREVEAAAQAGRLTEPEARSFQEELEALTVTDDQIKDMFFEFQEVAEVRRAEGKLRWAEERILNNYDEFASSIKEAELINKRNAALALLRRNEIMTDVGRYEDPVQGLQAKIAGTDKATVGGRLSTDARAQALSNEFFGGLVADLRKQGLLRVWKSGKLEKEIAQELAEIRPKGGKPGVSGSPQARAIAGVVHRLQNDMLRRLNRSGAWIRSMSGYITRQTHDLDKIRRAGFQEWMGFVMPLLDTERTFGPRGLNVEGDELEDMMMKVFKEIVSGRVLEGDLLSDMGANVAKKASASRFLHFKEPTDFLTYNARFGQGTLTGAIHRSMEGAAKNIALMDTFGPNPERQFTKLLDELENKHIGDQKISQRLQKKRAGLENLFGEVSGIFNVPVSTRLHRFGKTVRAMHHLSKLGGVLLSSLVDPAVVSSEFRYQGSRMLGSYLKTLQAVIGGRKKGTQREIADMVGVGLDGMQGEIFARFSSEDGAPGATSRLMEKFFKLTGLSWWNDAWKTGVGSIMMRDLAKQRKASWKALPDRLRTVLEQYEIGRKEWGLIRKAKTVKDGEGRSYITPAIVDNLDALDIADHLRLRREDIGIDAYTDRQIRRFRDDLATKIRSYIVDRVDYAVLTPGARETSMMKLGTKPGTPVGEAVRLMMQYKTFPITFTRKMFGREFSKGKLSGALGLTHLILATTALGYVARSAKAISKGRKPEDPKDPKTWASSLVQGGGLGIYGDFLFGEYDRYGHGFLSTAAGPTGSTLEDVAKIYAKAIRGEDVGAQAARTVQSMTPFQNLFYTRAAMDYLLFYQIQETLNPGYLRRMERNLKRRSGQEFLIPPSRVIEHGAWRR